MLKSTLPVLLLLLVPFLLISQKNLSYGVGIGLHVVDFSEDIVNESDFSFPEIDKARLLPSFMLHVQYELSNRWSLRFQPALNVKGASRVFGNETHTGYFIDLPIIAEVGLHKKVGFYAGPLLSLTAKYIVSEGADSQDVTRSLPERSMLSGILGFSYELSEKFSLNLSVIADIENVISLSYSDIFGQQVAQLNLRNQLLQLAFVSQI